MPRPQITALAREAAHRLQGKDDGSVWQLRVDPEAWAVQLSSVDRREAQHWEKRRPEVIVGYYSNDAVYLQLVADLTATINALAACEAV